MEKIEFVPPVPCGIKKSNTENNNSPWVTLGHYKHNGRQRPIVVNKHNCNVQEPLTTGETAFSMILDLCKRDISPTIQKNVYDSLPPHQDKTILERALLANSITTTGEQPHLQVETSLQSANSLI